MPDIIITKSGSAGRITLNRPKALNALCDDLFEDLIHAANSLSDEEDIGCLVLTGSQKAYAAGADISEMCKREFHTVYKDVSSTGMIVQYTPSAPHLCVTSE